MTRRFIKIAVAVALLASLAPAAAEANLTVHRGRTAIKREIHHFKHGYQAGSARFFCGKHGRNGVICDVLFTDDNGRTWCGTGEAARRHGHVHAHIDVGMEGCHPL